MSRLSKFICCVVLILVAVRTFAASPPPKNSFKPYETSQPRKEGGQGEKMLNNYRQPNPNFLRSPASMNTRLQGVCMNNHGAIVQSGDNRRGYENCLSNDRATNPSGQAGAGAAIVIYP